MSRCRCDPISVAGCQCSASDSDCIGVSGTGTAANPFQFAPNLDADPNNLLSCGVSGLMADLPSLYREPPRCKIRRNQDMTIPDGAIQSVEFNIEVYDSAGMWNPASPYQMNIVADGLYHLEYSGWWEDDVPNGSRRIEIVKYPSGNTISTVASPANTAGSSIRQVGSCDQEFEAGDFITMFVRPRDAGADVKFEATSSTPTMSLRWLAPLVA